MFQVAKRATFHWGGKARGEAFVHDVSFDSTIYADAVKTIKLCRDQMTGFSTCCESGCKKPGFGTRTTDSSLSADKHCRAYHASFQLKQTVNLEGLSVFSTKRAWHPSSAHPSHLSVQSREWLQRLPSVVCPPCPSIRHGDCKTRTST